MSKLVKMEHPTTNIMKKLPPEIILHILSRLPVTSLLQSMSVCRAWRILIRDPLLVTTNLSHMSDSGPSFIFQSNRPNSSYQLFFFDFSDFHSEGNVMFKKLPADSSMAMYLVDSCNGLLCMRDSQGMYIYNPFTRLHLELPKLMHYPAQVGHIAFGFHQTTKQYKVVQVVVRRQLVIRGDRVDVAASNLIQSQVHPDKSTTASLLTSFDLETEQFQQVPKPDCCGSDRCFHHLMVLRGCLSAGAYHDNEELEIWVMKEYGVKESWIKEFTLGTNYLPPTLQQTDLLHFNNARARFPNSSVRVLCVLRNDEILLEYLSRLVVVFDPSNGTFKELTFHEMPHWYTIVAHIGSLNWIHTPV
ncbi:Detected protein of unknown function [Hibiscus syriacus]|uniref:F-box domain-containing protein n=1 Tax=Hibiscus syriacus TaxID=106335 RepID=A0A6A2ZTM7_HIBSY|nr:Detected protein of unknown function [Hibiscus syriacus]